jgi:hypothetical protein
MPLTAISSWSSRAVPSSTTRSAAAVSARVLRLWGLERPGMVVARTRITRSPKSVRPNTGSWAPSLASTPRPQCEVSRPASTWKSPTTPCIARRRGVIPSRVNAVWSWRARVSTSPGMAQVSPAICPVSTSHSVPHPHRSNSLPAPSRTRWSTQKVWSIEVPAASTGKSVR